jgi:formylglycine-generating enzyme
MNPWALSGGVLLALNCTGCLYIAAAIVESERTPLTGPSLTASAVECAAPSGTSLSSTAVCPADMVFVPGGGILLGDHCMAVPPFCMGSAEVTAAAYAACVQSGACSDEGLRCPGDTESAATYGVAGKETYPVNCVRWNQADGYCRVHGQRLPNADEWEWAARGGGEGRVYPWGASDPQDHLCWSGLSLRNGPCPTRSFPTGTSSHGIFDLGGDVMEWSSAPAFRGARLARGGHWRSNKPAHVAVSARDWKAPDVNLATIGFRCAADAIFRPGG